MGNDLVHMNSLLIITPFFPYPIRSGGEQGQFNMIDALREKYHISIVFPINKDNHIEDVNAAASIWPKVKFFPYSKKDQYLYLPFLIQKGKRFLNRVMNPSKRKKKIINALGSTDFLVSNRYRKFLDQVITEVKPDIVQVEFIQNLNVVNVLPESILKLFVHHEIGFVITDRSLENVELKSCEKTWKEKKKKQEIERLNKYDVIITVTETDKQILLKSGVNVPIHASPSAVNTKEKEYAGWNNELVFVGGYNHMPNHEGVNWFLQYVTPLVKWDNYPNVVLKIIGSGWPQSYERTFNGLYVHLLGYVDDLSDEAYKCIMIVPLLTGSGMRMKILDAASLSLPFVATSVGAEGLEFVNGKSCLIGNSPREFAEALMKVMSDESFRKDIAIQAHQLYVNQYSLKSLTERRDKIYMDLLS